MRSIIYLIQILFISVLSFAQKTKVDKRTGVSISFSADGDIFPSSWTNAIINAKGKSLSESEFARSEKIVLQALSKYPVDVIKNNLKTIYILNSLEFYRQPYGGTSSNNIVYMSNKGMSKGYPDFYLEQLFHAEFSSVL